MNYWLMKSEPEVFGIQDLKRKGTEHWDGVRNYQARNFMRDGMAKGDQVLFYHSNCPEPGVAGLAEIVREGYPDFTAWHGESKYYDPKSTKEKPRWFMVDVRYKRTLKRLIPLRELRERPELDGLRLLRKGNRLSVMPVSKSHFDAILALERQ